MDKGSMSSVLDEIFRRERAAVFFHAPWSGASVLALARLRGVGEDDFCVVDIEVESSAADNMKQKGYSIEGWGEVAVIRSGTVRYFDILARDAATLDQRIAKFRDEKCA